MGAGWCLVGAVTAVSVPLLILSNLVLSELCFLAFARLLVALERSSTPAPLSVSCCSASPSASARWCAHMASCSCRLSLSCYSHDGGGARQRC
jgi:hypothetical protein